MKQLMTALAFSLLGFAGSAIAADTSAADAAKKPMTAQQGKMGTCQKQATDSGKTGTDRQAVLSECLKAKPVAAAKAMTPQQEKMGTCQKMATDSGKKGTERKEMLSDCLKKSPA